MNVLRLKKGGMGKGGSAIKIKDQWSTDQDDLLIHKEWLNIGA